MEKPVFIRSKDALAQFTPSVTLLVDSFVRSYMTLYFAVQKIPTNLFFLAPQAARDRHLAHISSIRGSTTASLLQNADLQDDVDIVVKFSSPLPAFSEYTFFRTFCLMLGIHVFEALEGKPSSILFDPRAFLTCSYESTRLIDKVSGVFKNFFPFPDQSKCIYSFSGLCDDVGQRRGVDLDITLVFRPEQNLRMFRPISPDSSSSSGSSFKEQTEAMEVPWDMSGSQSFAHDAVEVILPQGASRIDKSARACFRALFGLDMEHILTLLKTRCLVVLDEKMHLGYRRMFYEISKGKIPLMEDIGDWAQSKKIIQILCSIEENPISKIKPGLEPLLQLAKAKAEDKAFSLRLFMNGYMTTFILVDCLKKKNERSPEEIKWTDRLEALLHTFEREFIHDTWQEIFPLQANKISHFENPVNIVRLIDEVRAHLCPFPENGLHLSLGQKVRVAGFMDKRHGFILSRSLHFEEICFNLMQIKESISKDIFDTLIQDILEPIKHLPIDLQTKWMFLFFLRRLEQNHLCSDELMHLIPLLPSFLKTWIENPSSLEMFPLHSHICSFLQKWGGSLFPKEHELDFVLSVIDNRKKKMPSDPILLASALHYLIILSLQYTSDPSSMKDISLKLPKAHAILDVLLGVLCSEEYSSDQIKRFLFVLVPLAESCNQRSTKKIITLIRKAMENTAEEVVWDASEKTALESLVISCVDHGHEPFVVEIFDRLSTLITIDILPCIQKKPPLFSNLQRQRQQEIFTQAISLRDLSFVEQLFIHAPCICHEILSCTFQDVELLLDSPIIRENLASNAKWLCILAENDKQRSYDIYRHLTKHLSEKTCFEFTKGFKALWQKPLLPFLTHLDNQRLRFILRQQPMWVYEGKEVSCNSLSIEQLYRFCEQILDIDILFTKHAQFPSLSIILLEELIKNKLLQEKTAISFIDRYLPQVHHAFQKKDKADHVRYLKLIHAINIHVLKNGLSPQTACIIQDVMYRIDADVVSLKEYIQWAIKQPVCDAHLQIIDQKISKDALGTEEFQLLASYFTGQPHLIKNLISRAEAYGICAEALHTTINALIMEKKPLIEDLLLIRNLLTKNLPETIIQKALASVCLEEVIAQEHRKELTELLPKLFIAGPGFPLNLLSRLMTVKTLEDSEENFSFFMTSLIELGKLNTNEDIQKAIYKTITLTEATKSHFHSYVVKSHKNLCDFFSHLSTSRPCPFYLKILAAAIESFDLSKLEPSEHLLAFSFIEREIIKIHPLIKNNQAHLTKDLIEQSKPCLRLFLTNFFPLITKEHSSFLVLTWIAFNKDTIYQILPQVAAHAQIAPTTFLLDLFTFLVENEIPLYSDAQKEALRKCYSLLIQHPKDDIVHAATIMYQRINEHDPNWPAYIETLVQRGAVKENTELLSYAAEQIPPNIPSKKWEKTKKSIAALVQEYLCISQQLLAQDAIAVLKAFKDKAPIDTHAVSLSLFIKEIKKPYSERTFEDISFLVINAKTSDSCMSFTKAEIASLEKGISHHFKDIPFSTFLTYTPILSTTNFKEYFNLTLSNTLRKYATEFIDHMCSQPVSDKLYRDLLLISAHLIPLKDISEEKEREIKASFLNKIEQMLSSASQQEDYHLCITAALGIYSSLIVKNVESPKDPQLVLLCQRAIPIIHSQNIHMRYERLYLLSYVRILHAISGADLMIEFIKKMDAYTSTNPMNLSQKNTVFTLLSKSIIPAFMHDFNDPVCFDLISRLILKAYYGQQLHIEEINHLCQMFNRHVDVALERSQIRESSVDVTELLLMIDLLSQAIQPSSYLSSYRLYFHGISKLCKCPYINKDAIESMVICSHKSLVTIKQHPKIMEALSELNLLSQSPARPTGQTSLSKLLDILLRHLTQITTSAEKTRETLLGRDQQMFTMHLDGMVDEIKNMLFLLDQALVPQFFDSPRNLSLYLDVIPEDSLASSLPFFGLLLKKSSMEKDAKMMLKYSRLFICIFSFINKNIENRISLDVDIDKHPLLQSLLTMKNSLSSHLLCYLKELSAQMSSLPTAFINEILQLSLLRYHIAYDPDVNQECLLAKNLFSSELRKKDKNPVLLMQILSYLHAICKMRPHNKEITELAQQTAMKLWSGLHKGALLPLEIKTAIKEKASPSLTIFLSGEPIKPDQLSEARPATTEEDASQAEEEDAFSMVSYLRGVLFGLFQ